MTLPPQTYRTTDMESMWQKTVTLPSFPALEEDIKTDVLVVGGGLAGILTAYKLRENGVNCVIAEKERICEKVSGNTTAKITSQHGFCYGKILKSNGFESAKMYLHANQQALSEYEKLCKKIPCDFEKKDNFVYSLNDPDLIDEELKALWKIGCDAEFQDKLPLPFKPAGTIKFKNQAQFNPLKFVNGIVGDLKIYENTFVKHLDSNTAVTPGGKITFKKAVIATHFPIINSHGLYFMKLYQHRSYVIALENAADVNGMYVDENEKGLSFRNYENCLLLGGGSHKTGKKGENWRELRDFAKINYPESKEIAHWATQDCMSLDGIPYIGPYCKGSKDLFVATGFNKWGMTGSMVSAMLISDLITRKENPYAKAFDPSRSVLKPQLFINGFESVKNLLTPTPNRCSHLGCALKWNGAEHTWDCACHGSRFTESGKVLETPANKNLK